jgi:hypothetical protein
MREFESERAPIVRPPEHPCESCGATARLLIYVPNGVGGGRRLCPDCLRVYDALRAREAKDVDLVKNQRTGG